MPKSDEIAVAGNSDSAQTLWAARPLAERLAVLRAARHRLAEATNTLIDAIPKTLARTRADTMAAEILPLLAACKFLEHNAAHILKARRLGRRGLPFWLAGIHSSVERVALGHVLVIAPSNYPLFLPGVQVLQALAAGNAAIWKPGANGRRVARIFASVMAEAGLPYGLLEVTEESIEAGTNALAQGVDKIVFTGSSASGRMVLKAAAEVGTPVIAELSGCDLVIVLPSADVNRVVAAIAFGMRLNGSATCMAPRRLILLGNSHHELIATLQQTFAAMDGLPVAESIRAQLLALVDEAVAAGGTIHGDVHSPLMKPVLMMDATPDMQITKADVFAPVLSVMRFESMGEALAADEHCPFGLTAAIFGDENEALQWSRRLKVGTVLVNDLIAPTADPRIPFGGRRGSGFGVTRGTEGLLEMTAVKTVLVRRSKDVRHFAATNQMHEELFDGAIQLEHGASWAQKLAGLRRMIQAVIKVKQGKREKA